MLHYLVDLVHPLEEEAKNMEVDLLLEETTMDDTTKTIAWLAEDLADRTKISKEEETKKEIAEGTQIAIYQHTYAIDMVR